MTESPAHQSPTHLKSRKRPVPKHKGIRPYPWLKVHPEGHPHEGWPVERDARCEEPTGEASGVLCDRAYTQQQLDPEWLTKRPLGQQLAFQRQVPADPDGTQWVPVRCPRCERAALDREAAQQGRPVGPPRAWYENVAPVAEEPPLSSELFGGIE